MKWRDRTVTEEMLKRAIIRAIKSGEVDGGTLADVAEAVGAADVCSFNGDGFEVNGGDYFDEDDDKEDKEEDDL